MVTVTICFNTQNSNVQLANNVPRNGPKMCALQWIQNLSQTNWMIIISQILEISTAALVSAFTTVYT